MATEHGIILKTYGTKAIAKTERSETCAGCASRHSCDAKGDDMEVEVVNQIGAKEGDRVVIHLEARSFLKVTFMMYLFPILCLIGGALLGERIAAAMGQDPTNLSVILCFTCFLLSVVVIKIKGKKMGEQESYRPKIIRIL